MPQLPSVFRAAIGLAAEAAEQARHLPDRAIEAPMLAVSTALQLSLRAQQRYAMLAAKGDEVLHHRPPTDEPPAWATFDDPAPADDAPAQDAPAAATTQPPRPHAPPGKTVRAPRHGTPSRFDTVGDE